MSAPIYLDHHATTPMDPRVLQAVVSQLARGAGNAASGHEAGRRAATAVEQARRQLAELLACRPAEVVFTSGATEATNLALKGLWEGGGVQRLITTRAEHPATSETAHELAGRGCVVVELLIDRCGRIDLGSLEDSLAAEGAAVVSLSAANHELGTVLDLAAVAELAHAHGALLHVDAAQAAGKVPLDFEQQGIDLMSLSAHKFYGPMGVGALVVRSDLRHRVAAQTHGGKQERGLRSGTVNVPGVVGMGVAAELASRELQREMLRLRELRDDLLGSLDAQIEGGVTLNGPDPGSERLPGNLNVRIEGVDAEALIARTPGVCFSAGSACASQVSDPSPVLLACGLTPDEAESSVRFGLGRTTSTGDIQAAAEQVSASVANLRPVTAGRA